MLRIIQQDLPSKKGALEIIGLIIKQYSVFFS